MVAFVCFPEAFNVVEAAAVAANPATNMAVDTPSRVYRSSTVTPFFVVQSSCVTPIDVVAIVGTNLRNRDTVRIRVGSSAAAVSGEGTATADYTMPAYSGMKADEKLPMTVLRLPVPVYDKFVRVDVTATGHTDEYVQISRLVIGSAVDNEGIGGGSEIAINDVSVPYTVAGMAYFDQFPLGQSFKASIPYISDRERLQKWQPMLIKAGITKAVLFVPNYKLKANPNLLRDSQTFSVWSVTGAVSWLRNTDYAHDGSLTAAIMEDADPTGAVGNFNQTITIPPDAATYTVSAFVRKSDGPPVRVAIELTGGEGVAAVSTFVAVNPATGATNFAGNSNVLDAGDYWRIWRPLGNSVGHTSARIRIYPAITTPGSPLTGSSAAGVGKNSISGPQIERGGELTDWAPTSAALANDTHYAAMEQNDAVFGFITKSTPVKMNAYDYNSLDLTVTSIVL
ncbi:hypothetical protein SAMN05518849_11689 [Sphingobium sp. AP50]|uniref:phage head spike fiber domain-containing protein n=1 Tax=Sphingobium sp. AP50 TaxID=1884369 RepID=UPI0008CB0D69|nr:hypothetical protein [Sphingobium sp. AP50]SEJ87618.1 hypothetical protein SAMN05518849_11689 [Sphingobium sp. AP50]